MNGKQNTNIEHKENVRVHAVKHLEQHPSLDSFFTLDSDVPENTDFSNGDFSNDMLEG